MTVKALTKSDIDKILELYNKDFADGWNKQMLLSAFESGRFASAGCFLQEELVGVITYTKGLDDADIEGIVTKSEFRNQGVATTLFNFAVADVKESGIDKILLEVRQSNEKAINFYKKQGFNQISVRKKYYSNGENALILLKEI